MLFRNDRQPSLACGLDVALVVAPDPVADSHKVEFFRIKDVVMSCCYFQQPFCEPVVVLLLLGCVI